MFGKDVSASDLQQIVNSPGCASNLSTEHAEQNARYAVQV